MKIRSTSGLKCTFLHCNLFCLCKFYISFGFANFVFFFQRAKYRNIKIISDKTVDKHYPTLHSSSYPKDFPEKKSPVIIRREISHACVCLEYKGDHRFPKELPSQ